MYAGLNLNWNLLETRHDLRATIRSFAIRQSKIFRPADGFFDNHFAVDGHDERTRVLHRAGIEPNRQVREIDAVLAVRRKIVFESNAAASARGHYVSGILTHQILHIGNARIRIAHDELRNCSGSDDVLINKSRRSTQCGGDVVESVNGYILL